MIHIFNVLIRGAYERYAILLISRFLYSRMLAYVFINWRFLLKAHCSLTLAIEAR